MQIRQKECPQLFVTGSVNKSLQMGQVNSCSRLICQNLFLKKKQFLELIVLGYFIPIVHSFREMEGEITFVHGDLLESKEKYIAHQCNCITTHPLGMSKTIFQEYPHADCYTNREAFDEPGTISIAGDGSAKYRFVINMFAQYYPGPPRGLNDSSQAREKMFQQCLDKISDLFKKKEHQGNIAFPNNIGCGLAQGKWEKYHQMLKGFAKANPKVRVFIYKKN